MFILWALAAAAVLVFFGYIALLGTHQANIPENMSKFGKWLAIALFVVAGLVFLVSVGQNLFTRRPYYGRPAFNYNPMMQRQPGAMPFGAAVNRPGVNAIQPAAVNAPQVTPAPVQPAAPVARRRVPAAKTVNK